MFIIGRVLSETDIYCSHPSGDVKSASGHRRLGFQGESRLEIVCGCHWRVGTSLKQRGWVRSPKENMLTEKRERHWS